MPDDENIISLEQRRRKAEAPSGEGEKARAEPSGAGGGAGPGEGLAPIPGKLTWLHCPTCKTLQYTELWMPAGRVHNVCGTEVAQAEVEIDVRAEVTIAEANLERLGLLGQMVEAERARYEEYRERLGAIAGEVPAPYGLDEARLKELPVAALSPLGLLVPQALHNPGRYFGLADPDAGDSGERPPGPEGGEQPPARAPGKPPPKP